MALRVPRVRLPIVLAALVLVSTVPLGVFSGWVLMSSWRNQAALVDRQNIETARAISLTIDEVVESGLAALTLLAALEAFDDLYGRGFEELAGRFIASDPRWHALLLADPRGAVLASSAPPGSHPATDALVDWVGPVLETGGPVVSDIFLDPALDRFFVVVAVPVRRAGQTRFVIGAQLPTDQISQVLRRQHAPPDGVVTLIGRDRRIIARSRNETRYVGGLPSPGFQRAAAEMSEGSWREVLLEGTPAYAALSRSSLTGWTVGIGRSASTVEDTIWSSLRRLLLALVVVLALALASALAIGTGLVRTLRAASASAVALARGVPVGYVPSRVVEFDGLSRALTEAAAALEARRRERDLAEARREDALAAEQAARATSEQNEQRLAVTLRSIGDAVIAVDARGRVTLLNAVAQSLTGWSEADAIGQPLERVFVLLDEATRRQVALPPIPVRGEGPFAGAGVQALLVARDDRLVPIEDTATPLAGPDGRNDGMVLVFRDVTGQREAERRRARFLEQEQEARREAEALNRGKDEFVATLSHELRTPLNAMMGWLHLLKGGQLDAGAQTHALEVIDRNARAQAQLVEDLIDASKILRGVMRLQMCETNVVEVVEATLESVRPTAAAKRLKLSFETARPSVRAWADPDRLQQVIWNLLSNSIKFTPAGGIDARIWVEDPDILIRITDTGIGISGDVLPYVFDRFRQGSSSSTREHSGLGLGLALVRHLTELHGGRVTARSDGPGLGSVFTLSLPLLKG
jgi:PAS domain S-box-containing protein